MLQRFFFADKFERLKLIYLTITFFLVIGGYTLAKELGGSIFISIVGKEYVPWAKVLTMIVLVPAILFYASLVDHLRRYKLLALYAFLFGILGLVFAYFIGHPTIGISNTNSSPSRLFGWFFYFFVEGYQPFVVSVFWAFANSVSSPEEAKKNYPLMVSGSKLGGMLAAGLAWALFAWSARQVNSGVYDVINHQIVLCASSFLLILVPVVIFFLMRHVPGKYLHGYEAVYQLEKAKRKQGQQDTGIFAGLTLLLRYPYVLGIFGMVYFYEVVATVLSYLRLGVAQSSAESISGVSSFLFETIFMTHVVGFIISLVGTRILLDKLGERVCLMLIPVISGLLLLYFMVYTSPTALMIAFVAMKAVNYAFSWPVRESLYIPTIKEIKFKSKSWIDAFGSKFAKTSGSTFNIFASKLGTTMLLPAHSFFFAFVTFIWFMTAFALGKRYDIVVSNNEVIGIDKEND